MSSEVKKWSEKSDNYYKVGDLVLRGTALYSLTDDCWRYAPDVYFDFVNQSDLADAISEEEARQLVESNGGSNFDKQDELLYVINDDGEYSGIYGKK